MIEIQNIIMPFKIDIFNIGSISNRKTDPIMGIYRITAPSGKIYIENQPKIEENNERFNNVISLLKKHDLVSKINDEIDRLNKCHNRKLTEINEYYFEARTFLIDIKNKINEIIEI